MQLKYFVLTFLAGLSLISPAQTTNNGIVEGRIYNSKNNDPVSYATIVILNTNIGSQSDSDGKFIITDIKPGYIILRVTLIGYKPYTSEPIMVTGIHKVFAEIPLEEAQVNLQEVKIASSLFRKKEESPVSLKRIGIEEIEKNPGSNRDISRVIQAFPGVSSSLAYRNDVIVRGGGAAENRFYLDGIEIPNLNHFATQGASGGPVGIINVDFIREVNFYSGAFPANRGNALSSILELNQIDGNTENTKFKGSIGASDLALTLDGPLDQKTTFIVSARRSYLQFLFAGLGLPFLPTYNDFQFKVRSKLNNKNEISIIALGALDQFKLNLNADETESQRYILNYLPVNEQWNYTFGIAYKHFGKNSYDTWVISRNHLDNVQYKYRNNIEVDSLKILDYESFESENKLRYERTILNSTGYKINLGANFEYAKYFNNTFRQLFSGQPYVYKSSINFLKWGAFGQVSKSYYNNRLALSLGIRADANSFTTAMSNLLNQVSPRFSLSYSLGTKWTINSNIGRYYQLPPYTTLGFRDLAGNLVNKENAVKYITSDHLISGFEYMPNQTSKLSFEGFYKWYRNYPFSIEDSISISSKGADYGTFGDEAIRSTGKGRAYGIELFYQNTDLQNINLIVSYTLVRSESEDYLGKYIPTSWDNKHIINITGLKNLKRNWNIGFKWRFAGGTPYTPWDIEKSSITTAWEAQGRAYLDYTKLNQLRLKPFHKLDIRVEKEYFLRKSSLRFYIDVQNIYAFKADEPSQLVRATDAEGNFLPPAGNPLRYQLKTLETDDGTVLPSIGIIVEF